MMLENDKVVPGTDRIIVNGGVNIEESRYGLKLLIFIRKMDVII